MEFDLKCSACGAKSDENSAVKLCAKCGGVFDIHYAEIPRGLTLPLRQPDSLITLGEVATPTVPLAKFRERTECRELYAKIEYYSPTGSFKDRGSSVLISAAREDGVTEFVEDTSGNAGSSMSAYAAKVGIKASIFVPKNVSPNKLAQIRRYGASVHIVEGDRYQTTLAAAEYSKQQGVPAISHNYSPHFIEGMKSFVYELSPEFIEQLDAIIFPVGNGSLLLGTWIGLREMARHGKIAKLPQLCAAQAANIAPVHSAATGAEYKKLGVTIASGISVEQPLRLGQITAAVRKSGGLTAAVSEDEIIAAQNALASSEGIYCEATAAVPLAAIEQSASRFKNMNVLVALTGSGLKDPVQ